MGFFENVFGAPQDPKASEGGAIEAATAAGKAKLSATPGYSDPAIEYASRGSITQLGFRHVPTGKETYFMAFVTEYSDQFTSEWNEENVYGRMDPIPTFQRTGRKISVSWEIPADSYSAGYINLVKCQGLIKFLYPVYNSHDNANSISQAPIIRMKFANLIAKSRGPSLRENGLLGYLGGITFTPDMDAGFFDGTSGGGGAAIQATDNAWMKYVGALSDPAIAPKVIKLSCDFTVLHERSLGWSTGKEWIDNHNEAFFPYQIPSGDPDDEIITGGGAFGDDSKLANILGSGGGARDLAVNRFVGGDDDPDADADADAVVEGK